MAPQAPPGRPPGAGGPPPGAPAPATGATQRPAAPGLVIKTGLVIKKRCGLCSTGCTVLQCCACGPVAEEKGG